MGQLKDGGVDRRPWALASTPAPKLNGKFLGMALGHGVTVQGLNCPRITVESVLVCSKVPR